MNIHILGIGGTFMGGVALLAKAAGYEVSGSDMNVYPPMSTQLLSQGIALKEGYDPSSIDAHVDLVIVGNVIKRGNPAMEYVLNHRIPYQSGPEWLSQTLLKDRHVLAVAGTHGKTTTSSLLAWVLETAGVEPGYLIGGIPENFGISARLGQSPYFVIEADEYDCAFFDKRAKFIHYHPQTLILNNLEYDHADIYPNLAAIQQQFHYLIRTIPQNGHIMHFAEDSALTDMLSQGCWTPTTTFGGKQGLWQAHLLAEDGSAFQISYQNEVLGEVHWSLVGQHNVNNALGVLAVAHQLHLPLSKTIEALATFKNVKRRLEVKGKVKDITIYDDFAHHPTAIATTLAGLRAKIGASRLIAVLEFGSYTMRTGVHKDRILGSLSDADLIVCKTTTLDWGLKEILAHAPQPTNIYDEVDTLVTDLVPQLRSGDHVVVMSNGGFGGIHQKLLQALA